MNLLKVLFDTKKALRESEEYNRNLFEQCPIGLALCRMDGTLVDVNPAYAKIIGRTIEETLHLTYWDITPKQYEADEQRQLELLGTTGRYGPYEKEYIHKDGRLVPVRLSGLIIEKGSERFIWSSVEDVTERNLTGQELVKRTEELARSKVDREQLEVFTYLASHDLQEPLQKIISFGELLKAHAGETFDRKARDYFERMQNAARRMSRLIQALLDLSRITTKKETLEKLNLEEIIQEVISDLELRIEKAGGRIEINSLPVIRADRSHMYQLFQNLISNAMKFRKKGQPPFIKIQGAVLEGGFVRITVEDNGIGFDQKDADRIFKPFDRLHGSGEFEGSGVGLAICQKIVQRHGGQIMAKSALGQGATFIVTLPVSPEKTDEGTQKPIKEGHQS